MEDRLAFGSMRFLWQLGRVVEVQFQRLLQVAAGGGLEHPEVVAGPVLGLHRQEQA